MPVSTDILNNLTAKLYNATCSGLNVSDDDFQMAQGDLTAPQSTQLLWTMMNQVPSNSIAQMYDPSTVSTFSSEFRTILSNLTVPGDTTFQDLLGSQYPDWVASWKAYAHHNLPISSALPTEQARYFNEWATMNLDPGTASQAANALNRILENPVGIGQQLMLNLLPGGEVPFTETLANLLDALKHGEARGFSMDSSDASADLSGAWASSSGSAGGTVFYTKTESQESQDFTETFASSRVTVETSFQNMATVPFQALANGTIEDGDTEYAPWFYPAALTSAYQDKSIWDDQSKWGLFFGPDGSLQYVATALVVVDGVSQTIQSDASYSTAHQTYAHSETKSGYGCWPYYVSSQNSETSQTSVAFDENGQMTLKVESSAGNPVVIGMLVSPIKNLIEGHG